MINKPEAGEELHFKWPLKYGFIAVFPILHCGISRLAKPVWSIDLGVGLGIGSAGF